MILILVLIIVELVLVHDIVLIDSMLVNGRKQGRYILIIHLRLRRNIAAHVVHQRHAHVRTVAVEVPSLILGMALRTA